MPQLLKFNIDGVDFGLVRSDQANSTLLPGPKIHSEAQIFKSRYKIDEEEIS